MSGERHPIFPLDPQDGRVDTLLMSPDVNPPPRERKPWEPAPVVTPYPTDLMECLCGAHIWISQEGRRYEYGGLPHACQGPEPSSLEDLANAIREDREKVSERNLSVSTETAQDAPDATETVTDTADPLKDL